MASLAYALISLFLGVIAFTVTVVLWSTALAGVTYPLYGWALPTGGQGLDLTRLRAGRRHHRDRAWSASSS